MKTKSFEAGAMFMKSQSSGARAVSFLQQLCSPGCSDHGNIFWLFVLSCKQIC